MSKKTFSQRLVIFSIKNMFCQAAEKEKRSEISQKLWMFSKIEIVQEEKMRRAGDGTGKGTEEKQWRWSEVKTEEMKSK